MLRHEYHINACLYCIYTGKHILSMEAYNVLEFSIFKVIDKQKDVY